MPVSTVGSILGIGTAPNNPFNTAHTLGSIWQTQPTYFPPGAMPMPTVQPSLHPHEAAMITNEVWRMKLLAMRLRLHDGERFPFENIFTAMSGDNVFVIIVDKGEVLTFTDNAGLFPSDTLITQIRMIQK